MTSEFDELDAPEMEYKPLDIEVVRQMVPSYSSQKLCEMIICDRYFGCYREIAVMCMEELAQRRVAGDSFAFEKVINDGHKTLPELNFGTNFNIRDVLQQAIKGQK
jgi:hypothetical protein